MADWVWEGAQMAINWTVRQFKQQADHSRCPHAIQLARCGWHLCLKLPSLKMSLRYIGPFSKRLTVSSINYICLHSPRFPCFPAQVHGLGTLGLELRLMDSQKWQSQIQYLVDWEGYGSGEQCWVPAQDTLSSLTLPGGPRALGWPHPHLFLFSFMARCGWHLCLCNMRMFITHLSLSQPWAGIWYAWLSFSPRLEAQERGCAALKELCSQTGSLCVPWELMGLWFGLVSYTTEPPCASHIHDSSLQCPLVFSISIYVLVSLYFLFLSLIVENHIFMYGSWPLITGASLYSD